MRRFDWLRDVFESMVGLVAGSLTILLFLKEFLDLTVGNTLLVGILIAQGGLYLGISALERDTRNNFEKLRNEIDRGFDKVVARIETSEMNDCVRTDGVGQPARVSQFPEPGPSGNGALGGMIAGGALGLPFGPVGAAVGGVLGGLIGNEIEYRDLKQRERAKLERAASRYLHTRANVRPEDVELVDVTGPGATDDGAWRLTYREIDREHVLELDPETGVWQYESDDP